MTEYTTLPPGWVLRLTDDGSVVLSGPKRGQYSCVGDDEPNAAGQALYDLGRALSASAGDAGAVPFQARVQPWMMACFGAMIAGDREERNHRFLEEALELVQSCGCTASEAHQLVDYVFGRPVGEPAQEVGGVMVTLAALCLANGLDMHDAAETELARIWTKVEAIRAKQAAKPKHSPLPAAPHVASAPKEGYHPLWPDDDAAPSAPTAGETAAVAAEREACAELCELREDYMGEHASRIRDRAPLAAAPQVGAAPAEPEAEWMRKYYDVSDAELEARMLAAPDMGGALLVELQEFAEQRDNDALDKFAGALREKLAGARKRPRGLGATGLHPRRLVPHAARAR
jgi:hypothetical protein